MATASAIVARYETDLRFAFLAAVREVDETIDRSVPPIPRDTGRLKRGIKSNITNSTGTRMTARFWSTAEEDGFDYPSYLDKTPRVAPTKAKLLVFEYKGKVVRSKGFVNRHQGWWTEKLWRNGQLWYDAIQRELLK